MPSSCAFCASGYGLEIPYPSSHSYNSKLRFERIAFCSECHAGKACPEVTQDVLNRFYNDGSYWHHVGNSLFQAAHEKIQCKQRVERSLPYLTAAATRLRCLDFGAGHGWIAEWLRCILPNKILEYHFVEPDEKKSLSILNQYYPFQIQRLMSIPKQPATYDLIFLNHVLEHVAEPMEVLESLRELVSDRGIVYVETPHADYRFKSDVFPHTHFFTRKAFLKSGERLGVRTLLLEEFGSWSESHSSLMDRIEYRILAEMFRASVLCGIGKAQEVIDRSIWKYGSREDGIWLRWIFTRT